MNSSPCLTELHESITFFETLIPSFSPTKIATLRVLAYSIRSLMDDLDGQV